MNIVGERDIGKKYEAKDKRERKRIRRKEITNQYNVCYALTTTTNVHRTQTRKRTKLEYAKRK